MADGDMTRPDIDAMLALNETARKRVYEIAFERIREEAKQGMQTQTLTLDQVDLDDILKSDPIALAQAQAIAARRALAAAQAEIATLKSQRP